MSQKRAKLKRKLPRPNDGLPERPPRPTQGNQIPIAGCPQCEHNAWYLVLDAMPPHHTAITQLVCERCKVQVPANFAVNRQVTEEPKKDTVPEVAGCPVCEFDLDDCQC